MTWPRLIALVVVTGLVSSARAPGLKAARREAPDWRRELAHLKPEAVGGRLIQPLEGGGHIELTLDPHLQELSDQLLAAASPSAGAAVVVSVKDGRVLALAGRSGDREEPGLALRTWAPAASVFKLVTTAALLEQGVTPRARVCYHGGVHSIEADNLVPDPSKDSICHTLAFGLAKSQNAIFARLALSHLDPEVLTRTARALGFGAAPAFELETAASAAEVPAEPLAFARVAAGFWQTALSPLHGAQLAATIARGGEMPGLTVVERVIDGAGQPLAVERALSHRALAEPIARQLARLMVGTTEFGTARAIFRRTGPRRGRLTVAGKTGSLIGGTDPQIAYSWFVGFAPAERPELAFAVLLAEEGESRVKAAVVAREILAGWSPAAR